MKKAFNLAGILAISLFIAAAPVAVQAAAHDDFAGTGALSGAWTTIRSGLTRSNGMMVEKSSFGIIRRNDIAPGAAQYSEGVWGVNAANIYNGQLHLFVRMVDIDNYYQANLDDGRHSVSIIRRIAGSNSTIFSAYVPANFLKGDTIKLAVNSAYLFTLYRNGTAFGSFNDAANGRLLSGGVGIGAGGLSTDQGAWDYWEGGDAAGGGCPVPKVTIDPQTTSVSEPSAATFTMTATGTPLSYQWQRGAANVFGGSGGASASYTTPATTYAYDDGATFRAIATNSCGADTSAAATLTVNAKGVVGGGSGGGGVSTSLPFSDDFENDDSTCWASRPNGDENSAGCGGFTNIGKGRANGSINCEGRFGIAHSGTHSVRITYTNNEDESRFRRNHIDRDSVFARFWVYFDPNYDHAFGEKFFRAFSLDSSTGTLYWDIIFYLRSATQTGGKDNMASITGEPNGGSGSFGTANIAFPRGVWFEVAFKIRMNTPGGKDGQVTVWYNNAVILASTGLSNMRTSSRGGGYNYLTDNHKITSISYGGWYSNGATGAPNIPAVKYLDDVCVGIVKCPSLVPGAQP